MLHWCLNMLVTIGCFALLAAVAAAQQQSSGAYSQCTGDQFEEFNRIRRLCVGDPSACCTVPQPDQEVQCEVKKASKAVGCCIRVAGSGQREGLVIMDAIGLSGGYDAAGAGGECVTSAFVDVERTCERCAVAFEGGEALDCDTVDVPRDADVFIPPGACSGEGTEAGAPSGGTRSPTVTTSVTLSPTVTTSVSAAPATTRDTVAASPDTASPEQSPEKSSKVESEPASCFPRDARVQLESGDFVRMGLLTIGDRVAVGGGAFSEIFMFTHKRDDHRGEYLELTTAGGLVTRMTAGHFVYRSGALVPARALVVGDVLENASGGFETIINIKSVLGRGLYNPQTLVGDIIVDGLRVSTYTTAVRPRIAHALLSPLRAVFACFGWSISGLEGDNSLGEVVRRTFSSTF
jgi:hypothetical protein